MAIDFGRLEDFKPDRRGENVLNIKCKHGGKAVKISNFVEDKFVVLFGDCKTAADFKLKL